MRRFLLHVLPNGFHRIRHYGLFANGHRADKLALCRSLLDLPATPTDRYNDDDNGPTASNDESPPCPCCGGRMKIIEIFEGPLSRPYHARKTLVIPLPRKNQPSRRTDGNNHPLPNPHPAAASSFLSSRQNRQRANRTARKRRTCRRPSTHPPLAFAQSSGNQLDQISIA